MYRDRYVFMKILDGAGMTAYLYKISKFLWANPRMQSYCMPLTS